MSQLISSAAITGDDLAAHCAVHFLRRAGLQDISVTAPPAHSGSVGLIFGANASRLLRTIDDSKLLAIAHVPDREQVRLAKSGYLLSELPLGKFYADRYGAPLLNIEQEDILSMIADPTASAHQVEDAHIQIATRNTQLAPSAYSIWQSTFPIEGSSNIQANITWLGEDFIGWQFATPRRMHMVWFAQTRPTEAHLHPALHAFMPDSEGTNVSQTPPQETMYSGNLAFVGHAVSQPWPTQLPFLHCGIEDAWVLSRMLENYDDDVHTALSEYERYRLPRHRKIHAQSDMLRKRLLNKHGLGSVTRNLGIAFRTRFLPEMAMNQVDWFHQYDCIRGFR